MEIPFERWYSAIKLRKSRRRFIPDRSIKPEILAQLNKVCREFAPFPSARSQLVVSSTEQVFKGIVGGYGKIKGAPVFIAFIGDMQNPHVQEAVGYTGEGIILEATTLGLDTCWVGGFFRPEIVASLIDLKFNERILAITPVGYAYEIDSLEERLMSEFTRRHKRIPLSRIVTRQNIAELPEWIRDCFHAARLAPSAINRQPWGFVSFDGSIEVFVRTRGPQFSVSKRLDCGIAMLHIEVSALNSGNRGAWELLDTPKVARYTVYKPASISNLPQRKQ